MYPVDLAVIFGDCIIKEDILSEVTDSIAGANNSTCKVRVLGVPAKADVEFCSSDNSRIEGKDGSLNCFI